MFAYLANQVEVVGSLDAQAQNSNAAFNGDGVDIGKYEMAVLVHVNSPLTTAGTVTFTVEDSADNVSFTPINAAYLINPDTGVPDTFTVGTDAVAVDESLAVRKENVRRYIRVVATTASSFDGTFAAFVVGLRKYSGN